MGLSRYVSKGGWWWLSSSGVGDQLADESPVCVVEVMGLDGGRSSWICLHQMRGSMMINFSPANEKAGNAGLGKLGPPSVLCQHFFAGDMTMYLGRSGKSGRWRGALRNKAHGQSSGSTRHTNWPGSRKRPHRTTNGTELSRTEQIDCSTFDDDFIYIVLSTLDSPQLSPRLEVPGDNPIALLKCIPIQALDLKHDLGTHSMSPTVKSITTTLIGKEHQPG